MWKFAALAGRQSGQIYHEISIRPQALRPFRLSFSKDNKNDLPVSISIADAPSRWSVMDFRGANDSRKHSDATLPANQDLAKASETNEANQRTRQGREWGRPPMPRTLFYWSLARHPGSSLVSKAACGLLAGVKCSGQELGLKLP